MNLKKISDISLSAVLLQYFYKWHGKIEQRVMGIYCHSQIYRLLKAYCAKAKICFRYSFLGKMTEAKQVTPAVLDNSRVVRYLINFYKGWRDAIINYSKVSSTINLIEDTREQFTLSPTKIISIIIVTAILVNLALSIILDKQIGLWGWLMRGLFLFVGVAGLFCQADWQAIKKNSILRSYCYAKSNYCK